MVLWQWQFTLTNAQKHAKKEFKALRRQYPTAIILKYENEILALCEAFGKSGQSGGSAPYVASTIMHVIGELLMFRPISALTGEDDEWYNISRLIYQNKRDSRVFKEGKSGRAYFIDAIVFDGDIGGSFTGNGSVMYRGLRKSF